MSNNSHSKREHRDAHRHRVTHKRNKKLKVPQKSLTQTAPKSTREEQCCSINPQLGGKDGEERSRS